MNTIEFERKVRVDENLNEFLKGHGELFSQKEFTDVYFDNASHQLTVNSIWLRKRGEEWECKVREGIRNDLTDVYREISEEDEICRLLSDLFDEDFCFLESAIEACGLFPFIAITTNRSKYKAENVIVDVDLATCEGEIYAVAELELIGAELDEEKACETIDGICREFGLEPPLENDSKLTFFLKHLDPDHYNVLKRHGSIR